MASELASQAALGAARVYWNGAHATQTVAGRPFGSPLGKLHSEVRVVPPPPPPLAHSGRAGRISGQRGHAAECAINSCCYAAMLLGCYAI